MSRFFAASDDDSEENSGSEAEDSNESSEGEQEETKIQATKFGFESSDEDDEKRIVRTEKSKRYDEMLTAVKTLKNHMKINDWVFITTDFDNLQKLLAKAKNITAKEGIPRFYIRACLSIEDLCLAATTDKEKKMSTSNAKALNIMRQKLRKWTKEYAPQIAAYKANPLPSEEDEPEATKTKKPKPAKKPKPEEKKKPTSKKKDESEDEDEGDSEEEEDEDEDESEDEGDSDEEDVKKPAKKPAKKRTKSSDEDEDDEEEWDPSDSSDSEVDLSSKDMFSRSFWVKRPQTEEQKTKEQRDKKPKVEKKKNVGRKASVKEDEPKVSRKDDDKVYTAELIMKKLKEMAAARGKKSTNRQQVVDDLRHLATKATTPVVSLKVKTTLVSALNDLTLNTMQYQPVETWKEVVNTLLEIVDLLDKNPDVRLSEDEDVKEAFEEDDMNAMTLEALMESEEQAEKKLEAERKRRAEEVEAAGGPGIQHIKGNLFSFVQRCCGEFKSSLQHMSDPHQPDHVEKLSEYVARLKDEALLLKLVTATQAYYDKSQKMVFQRHTALLRLELIYYHYHPANDRLTLEGKDTTKDVKESPENATISQLAHFLYKHGEDFEKTRALLCHVYYLAHHNYFGEARDLFLMSHVQDSINDADIRTRILFNRTMAQLGLSAFRLGHFDQALDSLMELYLSSRIKELLAQGINQRFNDRDAEKEKLERRRQYPAHMHINLDVLESVHLLSAMFVEVPNTAQNGQDNKRKVISKVFRRFLDYHQGKAFNGPPENTRDCVMAATTKLQRGDWKKALENVQRMKMWKLMPQSEIVFAKVKHKIQEVGLRTYLLSYGPYYNALSLAALCDMFELEEKECYRLCSKMMVSEKLQGAWDQPSKCIYIFAGATNNLQKAALQFSEKAELFLQQNEKLLEQKFGHTFQHQRTWEGGGNFNYSNQNSGNFARRGFQRNNYALGSSAFS